MNDDTVTLLERELRDLAPHLEFAPTPDIATAVGARLRARPEPVRRRTPDWLAWPRRLTLAPIALAMVLVTALVLLLSPGARTAVADVLRGVPGIRVFVEERVRPDGAPTPSVAPNASGLLVPGRRVSVAEALARPGHALRIPSELGRPDAAYLDESVRGGMISSVWYADARLPQTAQPGVGAVLTQFFPRNTYFLKELGGTGAEFEMVSVKGSDGAWVEGGHPVEIRAINQAGEDVVVASRLAANTLMWTDGRLTLRLETALPLADAMRIAESVK